jgi:hypothetical protein
MSPTHATRDGTKQACSKHRKTDVLPLHAELVILLRIWLKGMKSADLLFHKPAKRRTWLMVKKDLARVGIAYETDVGIADFHAAGRHTHITELLRNGASLPEAMNLARHTDVKMTMRYTHIGIDDQAKALAALPALQMCCIPGVLGSHSLSANGAKVSPGNDTTPGNSEGSGVSCHPLAEGDKWRRRAARYAVLTAAIQGLTETPFCQPDTLTDTQLGDVHTGIEPVIWESLQVEGISLEPVSYQRPSAMSRVRLSL